MPRLIVVVLMALVITGCTIAVNPCYDCIVNQQPKRDKPGFVERVAQFFGI